MGQIRIGAGGWDYFNLPNGDRLKAYSSVYDFVEVNSTYYRIPNPSAVASWRRRVPLEFEFSVRCQKDLAELHRLELTSKTVRIIDSMEKTCRHLKATVLTVLVPKALIRDRELAPKLNSFLSTISLGETRIAIEFRGGDPTENTLKTLYDHNAVHSVDLSTQDPMVDSSILHSRLFGVLWFCQVFGCFEDSACSHRLWGLQSSSGSPSLLHLRALAPQKHVASSRQG